MKSLVRGVWILVVAVVLGACQGNNGPGKPGLQIAQSDGSWDGDYRAGTGSHEPAGASWDTSLENSAETGSRIASIRRAAYGVAPSGADVEHLSNRVGKRSEAQIDCIPVELTMILNTVGWHYGQHVHVQSGYRSANHNRRVGGARGSYHLSCEAVDIQVDGVDKHDLANFLKKLPGRGGVGTYCSVSTVHIDIGPKRDWHYGCRRHTAGRYARTFRRR